VVKSTSPTLSSEETRKVPAMSRGSQSPTKPLSKVVLVSSTRISSLVVSTTWTRTSVDASSPVQVVSEW
jgi:hypothetical protein